MRSSPKKRSAHRLHDILHHLQSEIFPASGLDGENFVSAQDGFAKGRYGLRHRAPEYLPSFISVANCNVSQVKDLPLH
jgi:hypothetical protein